jgi:hypothetical protein
VGVKKFLNEYSPVKMKKILSIIFLSCFACTNIIPLQTHASNDPFGLKEEIRIDAQDAQNEQNLQTSTIDMFNYFLMLSGLYATITLDAQMVFQTFMGYTLVNFIGGISASDSLTKNNQEEKNCTIFSKKFVVKGNIKNNLLWTF